jgi:hypothetical protein
MLKTEAAYDRVCEDLLALRRSGDVAWSAITDGTRIKRPDHDDAGPLSPACLPSLQQRGQSLQRADLRRSGRRDRLALRLPTTRAKVNSGDMPEGVVAVIDARPDGPARHPHHGVVDRCPCAFPLVVCHRPRLRSQRRQATNAAISTVTATSASDQRRRRQFTAAPLVMTEAYPSRQPHQGTERLGPPGARPTPEVERRPVRSWGAGWARGHGRPVSLPRGQRSNQLSRCESDQRDMAIEPVCASL